MPEKRLLYFSSGQVSSYSWKRGRLAQEGLFASNDEGLQQFDVYVKARSTALYYLLVDVIEEDFHCETIPYVRGRDRRDLLDRKLAQRYRDLSLAVALSLGYQAETRREEKILFSSFTNTQQFQPWLSVLRDHEVRLSGVYSLPLVSPLVGRRLGITGERYLLVSLQEAGLRQSFIENGRIRFSRLGQTVKTDPALVARAAALESARIQQYLVNMRVVPRTAGPLDVVVLAPAGQLDLFRAECSGKPNLNFHVVDLHGACRKTGLRSWPEGMYAERLFLSVLAGSRPPEQFADRTERRFHLLWCAQVGALGAGVAAFVLCTAVAGFRLLDISGIHEDAARDRAVETGLTEQYGRLQAQFPPMPTSSDNLKEVVKNYEVVQKHTASMDVMLSEVSQALAVSPQLDIDRIDWRVGADPRKGRAQAAAKGGAGGAAVSAKDRDKSSAELNYQVVEISGHVNAAQATDYRNIILAVNQFVDSLRKNPGMEVYAARLPFDLDADKSVSGDIGVHRPAEIPRFTVVAARRLGV